MDSLICFTARCNCGSFRLRSPAFVIFPFVKISRCGYIGLRHLIEKGNLNNPFEWETIGLMAQGLFLSTLSFIDHLMYRISLKDTTYFDFRKETWISNNLKDYSKLHLNASAFSYRSIQVEITKNRSLGLSKGWPPPLNRSDCLIEGEITVIKGKEIRDFHNWPLNTGWPLNMVPLNTGLTVLTIKLLLFAFLFDHKVFVIVSTCMLTETVKPLSFCTLGTLALMLKTLWWLPLRGKQSFLAKWNLSSFWQVSVSELMTNLKSKNPHYIRCIKVLYFIKIFIAKDLQLVAIKYRYLPIIRHQSLASDWDSLRLSHSFYVQTDRWNRERKIIVVCTI